MRLVLESAKEYVLDATLLAQPVAAAPEDERNVCATKMDDNTFVQCLMLTCMELELQKRFERFGAFEIVESLDALYKNQARPEHFEITKALIECKMAEGS
jgi:hypothetical protein